MRSRFVFGIAFVAVAVASTFGSVKDTTAGSIAVVVDTSEMQPEQFARVSDAVDAFLAAFSGENDELALFAAGEKPQMIENFTSDAAKLSARLDQVQPQGPTALYTAVQQATERLREEGSENRSAVVVFSSSEDVSSAEELKKTLSEADVQVDVIATPGASWRNQETLQQIASSTGGSAYFTSDDQQLREVASVLGRRLASGATNVSPDAKLNGQKPLAGYRRAIISRIVIGDQKKIDAPQGDESVMQQVLISKLRSAKIFDEVIDATGQSGDLDEFKGDPDTVVIMSRLLDYQRGNRMQRQFIGWKGEARYKVQLSVFDSESHQPLFAVAEKGSSSSGFLGGSQEVVHAKAVKRVVDRLVEDLKKAK
jgi:hypothetical protein